MKYIISVTSEYPNIHLAIGRRGTFSNAWKKIEVISSTGWTSNLKWGFVKDEEHYEDLKKFGAVVFEGIYFVDKQFFSDKRFGYNVYSLSDRIKL